MTNELQQIETQTMRGYIASEMTKLRAETSELFEDMKNDPECHKPLIKLQENLSVLAALQEIAYRLEYGFITEIGGEDLKLFLVGSLS